ICAKYQRQTHDDERELAAGVKRLEPAAHGAPRRGTPTIRPPSAERAPSPAAWPAPSPAERLSAPCEAGPAMRRLAVRCHPPPHALRASRLPDWRMPQHAEYRD